MGWRWLMRAALWVRSPPSPQRVKLFVGLLAICLAIAFYEHYFGWPSWATLDRPPRVPRF